MLKKCFNAGKQLFVSREFLFFLVIGVFNTFNGSLFAFLYSMVIPSANLAFVAGYLTSLIIAYFLNTWLAFRQKPALSKMIRFMISYIPNFLIQNLIVFLVYNVLHWHQLIAYLLAAAIGVPVTFILLKFFAFYKKGASNK